MKILEQLERIGSIHNLIKRQQTGTPDEFAKKVYVSKRQLYNILDELKLMGAPIKYDKLLKTYFYCSECEMNLSFDIEILDEKDLNNISGGQYFQYSVFSSYKLTKQLLFS